MTTYSVVENLDVFPHCRYGFVACLEMTVVNKFLFEVAPETLSGSVVIAVSLSATWKRSFPLSPPPCDSLPHSTGFLGRNGECNLAAAS